MIHQFFLDKRPHNGLTFTEYFKNFRLLVENYSEEHQLIVDKESFDRNRLNFQRSIRIQKTYSVNQELLEVVKKISKRQIWMVITENWCGDSAQNLPYIAKISEYNPLIDLRIILRDSNLDIMELYLTDGKLRSIPKLVSFDDKGNELFQWGPRPKEAQELVKKLKSEGKSKEEYLKALHSWYNTDKGKTLESEFMNLLLRVP